MTGFPGVGGRSLRAFRPEPGDSAVLLNLGAGRVDGVRTEGDGSAASPKPAGARGRASAAA